MPKPGWKTLTIRTERRDDLLKIWEKDHKRPRNQTFGSWFDNYLIEQINYEQELERYGPFISVDNIMDNHILLTDNQINKHVFVNVNSKEKRLECEQDASSECIHVGFCFGIPSVYSILVKNGFRKPKPSTSRSLSSAGSHLLLL
jgi:hypothetical protein